MMWEALVDEDVKDLCRRVVLVPRATRMHSKGGVAAVASSPPPVCGRK